MIDKIIGTFFSRLLAMLIMLIVIVINSNTFGATGTGTIGLVVLGLTILQVISNFIGGSVIVFLIPRRNFFQIFFLSYLWAVISNIVGVILLDSLHLIPNEFQLHLLFLSLSSSFFFINLNILQGKEDIKRFNIFQITQLTLLIVIYSLCLLLFKLFDKTPTVELYIIIFSLSYFIPMLFSLRLLIPYFEQINFKKIGKLFLEMSKLGFWVQLANLAQLMNYRLAYYFIERFAGRQPLGLFELGTKISEVVWIFPKSISLVQYARLANNQDKQYSKKLTLSLFKIVTIFAIFAVGCLLLIPANWLAAIFGPEFSSSKTVIIYLAPGIIFLASLSILAHHFAGYGKYWINTIASTLGFVITLTLGLALIPAAAKISTTKTLETAAMINSISYFVSFIVTLLFFIFTTKSSLADFLLTKNDLTLLKTEVFDYLKKKFKRNK